MTITAGPDTAADIYLPTGMVGLPTAQHFALADGGEGVFDMECLDEPGLGFVVIAPGAFFPDYAPVIDTATAERLALTSADDALLLLVVTIGDEARPPRANLLAPVVVNRHTKVASQVVLLDQDFPLSAPLPVA